MPKPQLKRFLLLSRRSYAIATENPCMQPAVSVVRTNARDAKAEDLTSEPKHSFWMKDPKTGNWIPENHIGELDVVELRDKFLNETKQRDNSAAS